MSRKIRKLPPRLIIGLASAFLLVLVLHFGGIALLYYFVERGLHPALPKGTYIGEVHLNLFTGTLDVHDFELRNEGRLRMRVGELNLDISPWRLLSGQVHVEHLALANGFLLVERRPDGSFDLGLPATGGDGPPEPETVPPAVSLQRAVLERITVAYHDGELSSTLYLDHLEAGAYSTGAPHQEVPVKGSLRWDGRDIAGDALITLDQGQLTASGRLRTGLLDLARAQELARLDPVVAGEAGLDGTFAWQAPRFSLSGGLQAPRLAYEVADRQAQLTDLGFPRFDLVLITAPDLLLELDLKEGSHIRSTSTRFAGQSAGFDEVQLTGRLRYANSDVIEVDGLALHSRALTWQADGRQATAHDVRASGRVLQNIAGVDPFPSMAVQLSARTVEFSDAGAASSLGLSDLRITDLALAPSDEAGTRRLSARLDLAATGLARSDSRVDFEELSAVLGGRVSATAAQLTADLALGGLRVADPALANGPLSIARVVADGLDLGSDSGFTRLRLQEIRLPAELPETALEVALVEVTGGRYSADGAVALGEIAIDGLQTGVIRNQAGQWRHVMSGPAPEAGGDSAAPAGDADADAAGKGGGTLWRLGGVRVGGDSRILVADHLNPDMKPIRYTVERITVGALDSAAPDRSTPFEVALRPDEYSEFVIGGEARPLAGELYLKAEGHVHGFGMTSVNGLVANDLGHRFLEGQLDNDFTIAIGSNRLEMENDLALAGLAVEEIQGKDGPPLATAIALLEDRDGNIKLQVPVAGDLSDPQFSVLGALNPIIMKAVAGTAALAIQPLGSVLLVGGLLADQALKVTFEPALFAPGSTELDPAARKYLGQLAGKLAEKPKLAVRLCGVVVESERRKDKAGKYLDNEAELLAQAQQRADAVRGYLASQGAGARQLRVCRPALDNVAEASPRVDIRF